MLARSITLNVLGQAGTLVSGFVSSILLARLLGPTDRGLLALLQSVTGVLIVLGGVGLPLAVAYFGSLPDRRSAAVLGGTLAYAAGLGAVFVPAFWLLEGPLAQTFARGRGGADWILAAALVPITFLDYTTQNQVLGQRRFGLYNLIIVLSKVAGLVAVVLLVGALDLRVTGGLLALVVTSATVIGLSLPRILAEGRPRLVPALLRQMLRYGARVQVGAVFQTLNYRLDVVVLQFFRPLSEVGYYVIAQIIAELVTTISSGFAVTVLPLVAGAESGSELDITVRSLRHHGVLTVGAILGNAVFGTLVIFFAYGTPYHAAIVPMLIILPGMWFLGTGTVVAGDLRGRGRPGTASALAGIAVLVTVTLDLGLIPSFGVDGAAIASLCAYTVYGCASLVVLARVAGLPLRQLLPSLEDVRAYPALVRELLARRRGTRTRTP